jgi:hypothetical protein
VEEGFYMTVEVEAYILVQVENGTCYRIRHNPDVPSTERAGLVLEWSDDASRPWNGYFFIAPDAVDGVIKALTFLQSGNPLMQRESSFPKSIETTYLHKGMNSASKIKAIKAYRAKTGSGLLEAKNAVEARMKELDLET